MVAEVAAAAAAGGPSIGSVFGGAIGGGAVTRILQIFTLSKFEKAQIKNMEANIDLQKERLRAENERSEAQLHHAREAQIRQIEHSTSLQERQIEANIDLQIRAKLLENWPLKVQAQNILKRTNTSGSPALNIITKLTLPTSPSLTKGDEFANTRDLISIATDESIQIAQSLFGPDLVIYDEMNLPVASMGNALATELHGQLASAPTVVFEIRVTQKHHIRLSVTAWGWGTKAEEKISTGATVTFDLSSQHAKIVANDPVAQAEFFKRATRDLSLAVLSLITQVADSFQVLRNWDRPAKLRLFEIMRYFPEADPAGPVWRGLIDNYIALFDQASLVAPVMTAETMAGMALTAFDAGQSATAELLLTRALDHYRAGNRHRGYADDAEMIRVIMTKGAGLDGTWIQEALHRIRHHEFKETGAPKMTLREMSAIGIASLRKH